MVTKADWIKIELSDAAITDARRRGRLRQNAAEHGAFRGDGFSSERTHILGCLGEAAVASYLSVALDPDWSWAADIRRGYDVGGWQVRTGYSDRSPSHLALALHDDDTGRFIRASGHQAPGVMWLIGWIDAAEGLPLALRRKDGHEGRRRGVWYQLMPQFLRPLPEQNGYTRLGQARWLIDPQTPFWCETCGGMHPIIEHRHCRALSRS